MLVLVLVGLVIYVELPLYGAAPLAETATPEIGTVPDFVLVETPTNTPFAIITIPATPVSPSTPGADQAPITVDTTPTPPAANALPPGTVGTDNAPAPNAGLPTVTPTLATAVDAVAPYRLNLTMRPSPVWVWQGQMLRLDFTIKNEGSQPLTQVRLQDDLPAELILRSSHIGGAGSLQPADTLGAGAMLTIIWPQIAAGATVTATVGMQIAPDTANGLFIDNVAAVQAVETVDTLAGVTIMLPPAGLPQFALSTSR